MCLARTGHPYTHTNSNKHIKNSVNQCWSSSKIRCAHCFRLEMNFLCAHFILTISIQKSQYARIERKQLFVRPMCAHKCYTLILCAHLNAQKTVCANNMCAQFFFLNSFLLKSKKKQKTCEQDYFAPFCTYLLQHYLITVISIYFHQYLFKSRVRTVLGLK